MTTFRFTTFYSTPPSWAFTIMDWARGRDNGGIVKKNHNDPKIFTHYFLIITPFSWALTFMEWARGGDNGGIMRQGGLLTVAQHCLPIVTR